MADVRRRVTTAGATRWDVRYRDDARRQRKRSFERKVDAVRFGRAVETDLLRGDWIDPRRAKEPFELWAATWRSTLGSLKPKTRESYESILQHHLLPKFAKCRSARSTTHACWPTSPNCKDEGWAPGRSATSARPARRPATPQRPGRCSIAGPSDASARVLRVTRRDRLPSPSRPRRGSRRRCRA